VPYIHQITAWPELTCDQSSLVAQLSAVRHRQGLLIGRLSAMGLARRREADLATLTLEAVTSSAIEGERLPPDEVRSSIARRLGLATAGLPTPTRAVEGVVEMLMDATQRYDALLDEERLFSWHAALFPTGRSGGSRITVGAWRTDENGPMQVVSGALGSERVHFEAPAAERLPAEMVRFLDWFNGTSDLDPLLKAAFAHFWFVTIHPFDDGNGRIARAIADLCLSRADGRRERFYSMSAQIEVERREYYTQLERSQRGELDITSWVRWFLGCLDRSFDRAEGTLERVFRDAWIWERANAVELNARQRVVLTRLLGDWEGHLTTKKYAAIAMTSHDTALRDIEALIACGVLARNPAGGRSVSYAVAERVAEP
jgi:Fic family protein